MMAAFDKTPIFHIHPQTTPKSVQTVKKIMNIVHKLNQIDADDFLKSANIDKYKYNKYITIVEKMEKSFIAFQ